MVSLINEIFYVACMSIYRWLLAMFTSSFFALVCTMVKLNLYWLVCLLYFGGELVIYVGGRFKGNEMISSKWVEN